MAVGTVTTTTVTIPGSDKMYKKVSYQNTADGAGAWATASLTNLYGYLIKVVISDAGTNPNATFSLGLVEPSATSGDHFFGAVTGVDFTSGNSSYVAIPGQTAGSVDRPIPVFLTGSYDVGTSSSNTTAAAVYQVDLYLVDSI